MEKFSIKPHAGQILRTYLFISLILPAMPAVISLIDFIINHQNFKVENYYEGYLYMSALGLGIFAVMAVATIPSLLKEKIIISEQNQLVLYLALKKPQFLNISDIVIIDRGYKQVGNGKVQVVNIYSANSRLTFELKKYLPEDIENLIARLKVMNNRIENRFDKPKDLKTEFKKYFS